MAQQRYRIALNNTRFPLLSQWGARSVVVHSADASARQPRPWQGSEENIDFNLSQVLYGENFVPVAGGLKSVSYAPLVPGIAETIDFDQIFPLRDADENTVLFSPSQGQNYVLQSGMWMAHPVAAQLTTIAATLDGPIENARVTRAYVDGKTLVCYANLTATQLGEVKDASLFYWNPTAKLLTSTLDAGLSTLVTNTNIPVGELDGISASNGYLLLWSRLRVYWAPFNGTSFDYNIYADGEVTGAGSQIPEDIEGPITAITPVASGFIIWTTKNAVAAMYNSNNFASPWIFKRIQNAGGVESFEQVAEGGNAAAVFAYTTGGLQQVSLNAAESKFPDATDFLGARIIERFNTETLTFDTGTTTTEFFVKVTLCGQRFFVISYGTFPGIYSFALLYDTVLDRWGKLRIVHRDCFSYSYGSLPADLTYSMLGDVEFSDLEGTAYEDMTIPGGNLIYPRQAVAFMERNGAVQLAVMDERPSEGEYDSFVLIGKNQFSRSKLVALHTLEIEGLTANSNMQVEVIRSVNGATFTSKEPGTLREQTENYSEWGFDMVTGKTFTVAIRGQFHLTTLIAETSNDGNV